MRKIRQSNIIIFFVVVALLFAGIYALLRPPAPKPLPEPSAQPAPASPQPIPGAAAFDVNKYKTEPTVSVWMADKGSVQSLPLETYLEGVIAQEMETSWPMEALAAQAITSRTLTVNAMEAGTIRKLHNADVSTSKEELQAYAPQKVNDSVKQAVKSTRGKVLLYAGSLVNAIYSSCNGQIGATKEESFPTEIPIGTPYFQPVADQCFQYAPAEIQTWSVKIPASEVAAAIGYQGNPGDITILEKGPSGRILYIGAGNKKMYGSDFRKAVGYDKLKSTLITAMKYDGSSFTFEGKGWGNGVGLCQWGAYTFAQQGWKAEEIVRHYYVDAAVKRLWE